MCENIFGINKELKKISHIDMQIRSCFNNCDTCQFASRLRTQEK